MDEGGQKRDRRAKSKIRGEDEEDKTIGIKESYRIRNKGGRSRKTRKRVHRAQSDSKKKEA